MNPMQLFSIFGEIGLKDQNATRSIQNVEKAGGQLNNAMGTMLKKIGLVAGAFAVGFMTKKTIQEFEQLEYGLTQISTLLAGDSKSVDRKIIAYKEQVQSMQIQSGMSSKVIADGIYQVVSAFGDTEQAAKLANVAIGLSVAGQVDMTSSVNFLSAVMKGYNDITEESAQKAADLAFQTVKLGQTTMPELAASMGNAVPLANALKVSQEELFGAFATLTGVTGNTAEVSTQVKMIFTSMMKPTEQLKEAVNALGYESAFAMVQQEGLGGSLKLLSEHVGGSEVALGEYFGSVEAVNGVLALTGSQAENFAMKTEEMFKASGEQAKAYEKQMDTLTMSKKRFGEAMNVVAAIIGERIGPFIKNLLDMIIGRGDEAYKKITAFFTNLDKWLNDTGEKLRYAFGPFLELWDKEWKEIKEKIDKHQKDMNKNQELNKVKWQVALDDFLAGVRKWVAQIVVFWTTLIQNNKGTFDALGRVIKSGWNLITSIWNWAVKFLGEIWRKYGEPLKAAMMAWGNYIMKQFQLTFNLIANIFDIFAKAFQGDWSGFWDAVKKLFSDLWADVQDLFFDGVEWLKKTAEIGFKIIGDIGKALWNRMYVDMYNDTNKMLGAFTGWVAKMLAKVEQFAKFIPGLSRVVGNYRAELEQVAKSYNEAMPMQYTAWLDMESNFDAFKNQFKWRDKIIENHNKKIHENTTVMTKAQYDEMMGIEALEDKLAEDPPDNFTGGAAAGLDEVGKAAQKAKEDLDKLKQAISESVNEINTVADLIQTAIKAMVAAQIQDLESGHEAFIKLLWDGKKENDFVNRIIYENNKRHLEDNLDLLEQHRDARLAEIDVWLYEKQKEIDKEQDAEERASQDRLEIYRKEADDRKVLVWDMYTEKIKAINAEIDEIDRLTEAEDEAEKQEQRKERKGSLAERTAQAKEDKKFLESNLSVLTGGVAADGVETDDRILSLLERRDEALAAIEKTKALFRNATDDRERERLERDLERAEQALENANKDIAKQEKSLKKDITEKDKEIAEREEDEKKLDKDYEKQDERAERRKRREELAKEGSEQKVLRADAMDIIDKDYDDTAKKEEEHLKSQRTKKEAEKDKYKDSADAQKYDVNVEYAEDKRKTETDIEKLDKDFAALVESGDASFQETIRVLKAALDVEIAELNKLLSPENLYNVTKEYFDPDNDKSAFALIKTWIPEGFNVGKSFGEKWLEGWGYSLEAFSPGLLDFLQKGQNKAIKQNVNETQATGELGNPPTPEDLVALQKAYEQPAYVPPEPGWDVHGHWQGERPKDASGQGMFDWEIKAKEEKDKQGQTQSEIKKVAQQAAGNIVVNITQNITTSTDNPEQLQRAAAQQSKIALEEWVGQHA